jgi:hypothetical protein
MPTKKIILFTILLFATFLNVCSQKLGLDFKQISTFKHNFNSINLVGIYPINNHLIEATLGHSFRPLENVPNSSNLGLNYFYSSKSFGSEKVRPKLGVGIDVYRGELATLESQYGGGFGARYCFKKHMIMYSLKSGLDWQLNKFTIPLLVSYGLYNVGGNYLSGSDCGVRSSDFYKDISSGSVLSVSLGLQYHLD